VHVFVCLIVVMSEDLERIIDSEKLQGMFLTNVLGFCGDLPAIRELCRAKKVVLIEDNCESLGTELAQGRAGSFGVMSSFSFYVAHHMSTIEGGVVCVDDPELGEMLRIVRANGWDRNLSQDQQMRLRKKYGIEGEFESKYAFYDLGYNLRPTEITGFLGLEQLKYLDDVVTARAKNYRRVEAWFAQTPELILPEHGHIQRLSNFAFPVLCRTPEVRRRMLSRFQSAGIEVRPLIAGNMTRQPFYAKYVPGPLPQLPGADYFHNNAFYFGNYPELTEADMNVIKACLVTGAHA
jgi:CDP-6-deoxy-D-xylo-4-hexulose-3-dehydrase